MQAAGTLGSLLAREGIELVYGGGNMGVMGELARAVMAGGGCARGVIPQRLNDKVDHTEITELVVVSGMHERKQLMYEMADAFIVMPGGIGTMEEFFEVFTWQQIGYHQKAIGIFNVNDFFGPLFGLIDHMVDSGFFAAANRDALQKSDTAEALLASLRTAPLEYVSKLIERK